MDLSIKGKICVSFVNTPQKISATKDLVNNHTDNITQSLNIIQPLSVATPILT
jgi:hypothetical protein